MYFYRNILKLRKCQKATQTIMTTSGARKGKKPVEFPYDLKTPIRSAFEKAVTATARLAAFAKYRCRFDSPIDDKLSELAIDDLLALSIHGRRLIEIAGARHCIAKETIFGRTQKGDTSLPLARILNAVVHHKRIVLIRRNSDRIRVGDTAESMARWLTALNEQLPPYFAVQSDKGDVVVFKASDLAEAFADTVIASVVEHCAAHGLDLEEERD